MLDPVYISDSLVIQWSVFLWTAAIIIGVLIGKQEFPRVGLPKEELYPLTFYVLLFGFLGAKVFDSFFYSYDSLISDPAGTLLSASGWMYYGGETGALAAGIVYLRLRKLPLLKPLDMGALILMVGHGIGRLACFIDGCCYGTECSGFQGIWYKDAMRHPAQLYEAAPLLLGFAVLWPLRKKIQTPGLIFGVYLTGYSLLRFFVEFYRFDAEPFGMLNLAPSQYIALVLFHAGVILTVILIFKSIIYKQRVSAQTG